MKKSLSLILAIAMVFSMFASVAFAAEASLDTNAKYEELKKAGIFEGTDGGAAALDQPLTRAQFAKIIVKVLDLKEDAASASIFNDLAGAGWASGFIGAAVKAGLVEGVAPGKFDPSANVTTEQLAKLLVLGLKLQQSSDAVSGNVSAWAKGYVAAAIKANLIPASADYTKPALRAALVEATYAAKKLIPEPQPAKIGIAEFKATGGKTFAVKLNGTVDTAKAKIEIKRNGIVVAAKEVKWADDKKSAVVTFESKLVEAAYTATLSGIDNLDSAKATAETKVEAEKVSKIEFLTATETLPQANDVRVEFKVVNQYGEDAKIPAANLKIKTNLDDGDWKEISGQSAIELDLATKDSNNNEKYERNDRINVTITHEDSRVSAAKTFTVGDDQIVSKVEIGKLLDQSGKEISNVEIGDYAYLQVFAYDQYGVRVIDEDTLEDDINFSADDLENGTATGDDSKTFDDDVDQDKIPDLKFYVDGDAKLGDYTITLYVAGGSATKKVAVSGSDEPASIAFGVTSVNLAEKDGEVQVTGKNVSTDSSSALFKKYVPIIVKNDKGEELSKDDIVNAAKAGKFDIDETGSAFDVNKTGTYDGIVASGVFKGQISLIGLEKGNGTLNIALEDKPEVKASINLYVGDVREVEELRLTSNNGDKGVNTEFKIAGTTYTKKAETKFKLKTFDQFGDEAKEDKYKEDYRVQLTFTASAAANFATDTTSTITIPSGTTLYSNVAATTPDSTFTVGEVVYGKLGDIFDKEFKLKGNEGNTYKIKAELLEYDANNSKWLVTDDVTKTYEVIDGKNKTLSWSASLDKAVKDGDNLVVQALEDLKLGFVNANVVDTDLNNDGKGDFETGKEIKLSAKDGSETLLVASDSVTNVTYSNSKYVVGSAPVTTGAKGYVYGLEEGNATVNVTFYDNKGNVQTAAIAVASKEASTNIQTIKTVRNARIIYKGVEVPTAGGVVTGKIYDEALFGDFKLVDATAGNEFSKDEIKTYQDLINVQYLVVDKDGSDDNISVALDGTITITDGATDGIDTANYIIRVLAPSGKYIDLQLGVE